jgi:hypothetical protein
MLGFRLRIAIKAQLRRIVRPFKGLSAPILGW